MTNLTALYQAAAFAAIRNLLTSVVAGEKVTFLSKGTTFEGEDSCVASSRADYYGFVGDARCVAYGDKEYAATAAYRKEWVPATEFMVHCGGLIRNVRKIGVHTDLNIVLSDEDKAIYENVDGAVALTFDIEKVKVVLHQLDMMDEVGVPANSRTASAMGLDPSYF